MPDRTRGRELGPRSAGFGTADILPPHAALACATLRSVLSALHRVHVRAYKEGTTDPEVWTMPTTSPWRQRRQRDLAKAGIREGPDFLYRPRQCLISDRDLSRLRPHLRRVGGVPDAATNSRLQQLRLGVTRWIMPATVDIPRLLVQLRALGDDDWAPSVAANTVLAGEPRYQGGPGGSPRPARPLPSTTPAASGLGGTSDRALGARHRVRRVRADLARLAGRPPAPRPRRRRRAGHRRRSHPGLRGRLTEPSSAASPTGWRRSCGSTRSGCWTRAAGATTSASRSGWPSSARPSSTARSAATPRATGRHSPCRRRCAASVGTWWWSRPPATTTPTGRSGRPPSSG